LLDKLLINKTTPGFFFVGIFFFAAIGLLLTAILLFWVYADSSPRNYRVEYKGNIEFNQNVTDNFHFRKETHHYRFQGISGQVIDVRLTTGTQIRYGIKFYLNNPSQLFEIINDPLDSGNDGDIAFSTKRIMLKNSGTYTLSVEYDFSRHSNYYDFDYFFEFWDKDSGNWVEDPPEYKVQVKIPELSRHIGVNLQPKYIYFLQRLYFDYIF